MYLSIACFNSQSVFCTTFLLKVPLIPCFILFLALLFVAQSLKYRDFKVPKPFLQFRNVLLRYRHIKCMYTNYRVFQTWPTRGQLMSQLCLKPSLNPSLNFEVGTSRFGNSVKLRSKLRQMQIGLLKSASGARFASPNFGLNLAPQLGSPTCCIRLDFVN